MTFTLRASWRGQGLRVSLDESLEFRWAYSGVQELLQAVTTSALTKVTTRSVDATDRVHYWRDIISTHFGALELQCSRNGSQIFDARLVTINLGFIKVSRVSSTAHEVIRTQRAIDRCDSDSFLIEVPLRGSGILLQLEQEAVVRPGDFALCDNARPFRYRFQSSFDEVVIEIPRTSLLARNARLDRVAPLLVSGESDMGRLIAPLLRRLGDVPKLGESPVAAQLGSSLVDLVATALGDRMGAPDRVPDRVRYLAQARAFIHDHLADSDMSPSRAAHAIGISPRYLHALFHDDGCSVSKWILRCRLDRARVLLVDPARKSSTITEIAYEVGFKDLAHFSRAFKAEFGVMPSSFRIQHQDSKCHDPSDHLVPSRRHAAAAVAGTARANRAFLSRAVRFLVMGGYQLGPWAPVLCRVPKVGRVL